MIFSYFSNRFCILCSKNSFPMADPIKFEKERNWDFPFATAHNKEKGFCFRNSFVMYVFEIKFEMKDLVKSNKENYRVLLIESAHIFRVSQFGPLNYEYLVKKCPPFILFPGLCAKMCPFPLNCKYSQWKISVHCDSSVDNALFAAAAITSDFSKMS